VPPSAQSVLLSALTLTLLHGCSNSHSVELAPIALAPNVDAGSDEYGPGTLCARYASLQCRAEQQCCPNHARSPDTCESAVHASCDESVYLDQVAANPSAGFDRDAAEQLFNLLDQKLHDCDPDAVRWSAGPQGLRNIFKGTIAKDQSCKPAQSLNADRPTLAAALLSCRDPDTTACLPLSLLGDWRCSDKRSDGNCLTDDNCQDAAYCSNPEQNPFGTCQARLATGESCSDAAQCDSRVCSQGACVEPDVQLAYCPSDAL
jgi:hypothetical protein